MSRWVTEMTEQRQNLLLCLRGTNSAKRPWAAKECDKYEQYLLVQI